MSGRLLRALITALLTGLLALPLGYFIAPWAGWLFFCAGLGVLIALDVRNFDRLDRWSRAPSLDLSLEGEGSWDNIFSRLYRHEKELRSQITQRDDMIERLIASIQALTDGVVLLDQHDQIVFCNSTAEEQLGLSLIHDRGQPVGNLVRQPEFIEYLEARDFSKPLILKINHGSDRMLSTFFVPYAAGNRMLMQIKDVTRDHLQDRMRQDFVANVSHELRTPLTVLSGFLETLQEIEVSPEERKRYLDMMASQSERMLSIVQDLLTLSTLESAPLPPKDTVDMTRMLERLRHDAEALSAGRHTIVVESEGKPDLLGSESELFSAFSNLVSNAIRYTPADGSIRISWWSVDDGAEFTVEDSGIGIDPKHIPRLTERFYRADQGRSRESGGTGLGLAIVKHALNRHQASLGITSTPGTGSCFKAKFSQARLVN